MTAGPVAAAIALVVREGRVLLVQRAKPPDAGLWGFPGGRIALGETVAAAAERELLEETGVTARALRVATAIDVFDRDAAGALRGHFVLVGVLCAWVSGDPVAGDDALAADWFAPEAVLDGALALSRDVAALTRLALAEAGRAGG